MEASSSSGSGNLGFLASMAALGSLQTPASSDSRARHRRRPPGSLWFSPSLLTEACAYLNLSFCIKIKSAHSGTYSDKTLLVIHEFLHDWY
jgi:hypothetical protein